MFRRTFFDRKWQPRRMVLTKKEILLGLNGDDEVRDHIPLKEVINVIISQETDKGNTDNKRILKKAATFNEYRFFNAFQIVTKPDGYNSGRTYHMQAGSKDECTNITSTISKWASKAEKAARNASRFERTQKIMLYCYTHVLFQSISSFLILTVYFLCQYLFFLFLKLWSQNFALNVYAAQMTAISNLDPMYDFADEYAYFNTLDLIFVILFTLELIINLYAHWIKPFLQNPWSIFDVIVVSLSLLGLAPIGMPLSLLLLFRCCRVLRIFGKFPTVSNIFSALGSSVIPMASTFFIIFVLASICEPLVLF